MYQIYGSSIDEINFNFLANHTFLPSILFTHFPLPPPTCCLCLTRAMGMPTRAPQQGDKHMACMELDQLLHSMVPLLLMWLAILLQQAILLQLAIPLVGESMKV